MPRFERDLYFSTLILRETLNMTTLAAKFSPENFINISLYLKFLLTLCKDGAINAFSQLYTGLAKKIALLDKVP